MLFDPLRREVERLERHAVLLQIPFWVDWSCFNSYDQAKNVQKNAQNVDSSGWCKRLVGMKRRENV